MYLNHLRFNSQMQSSEEKESQSQSCVSKGWVVATSRKEHSYHQAENHSNILVHAEGHDVTLGQCGVDVHDGRGQVDDEQLQHQHGQTGAGRGRQ